MFVARVIRQRPLVEQDLFALPEHTSSPSGFSGIRVAQSLVFFLMLCRTLFILLSFFCLSFFAAIRHLITPLMITKVCELNGYHGEGTRCTKICKFN